MPRTKSILLAGFGIAFAAHAAFALVGGESPARQAEASGTRAGEVLRMADARDYRHCHNVHTRVYCHKKDRLPVSWPPFSDRQKTLS